MQLMVSRRRRSLVAVAASILVSAALAACSSGGSSGGDAAAGTMTIRYEHSQGLAGTPIEVAYEQGFFKNHGLNVVDQVIAPGPAGLAALGRQSDVLQTSNQSILDAASEGRNDLLFVGGLGLSTQDNQAFPVYAANKSIHSWADLAGKTEGVSSLTGFPTTTIDYLASQHGVDPKTIKKVIVPFASLGDQLKAGRVDFGWSIKPYSYLLAQAGYTPLGDPTLEATGQSKLLASIHATTKEFAQQNPKALQAFQAGLNDAVAWMGQHPDETKQIAAKLLDLPQDVIDNQPMEDIQIDIKAADLAPMLPVLKAANIDLNLPPLESMMAATAQ